MTPLLLLVIGLFVGGVVNRIADTLPPASGTAHRHQEQGWPGWRFVPSSGRAWVVLLAAWGLGWLAQTQLGWTVPALLIALEAWFLLAIAVIDLEHHLVLNRLIGPALPLFFMANLFVGSATVWSLVLGGLAGGGLLLLVALFLPGAMGMGDVKLAGFIGAMVGLTNLLIALYSAILLGGIAAIVLLLRSHLQRDRRMAYAPYLVLGAWLVLFDGPTMLYAHFFSG
jgi:leader peptidase (prepilin peptidase)/N-methyltransferase